MPYTGGDSLVIEDSYVSKENSISYTITSIGNLAFYQSKLIILNLTQNTSLTSIGKYAFDKSKLTSLKIPNLVKTIGDGAFASTKYIDIIDLDISSQFKSASELTRIGITIKQ